MADVNRGKRPLSPFMLGQYYRPQWGSMTSIANRIAGLGLVVAGLMTVWWFVALAAGPEAYDTANGFITSWFGDLVMVLSMGAIWYHTLAGVRHLIWDSGHMLDVRRSDLFAKGMIAATVVFTVLTALIL